ncbi:MAG: SprB repeat-containing protein, partial [Bacteroidales bacterium]|nr:SprB repeat-containing protein [Bacteroidales bacterium]
MKKILYFLLFILPLGSFSQTWIISQHLKCDDDLRIYDIKKDINDDFYIAGIFKGTFEGNISEGFFDIFIAKLNSNFNLEWIQTAGSSSIEFDPRIIIDKENNIFLLGAFRDSCVFENQYLKSDGNYDVFLAKYSSGGKLNWAKKIANYPSQQSPTDIDVDNDNNLIITGHYTDSIFIYDEKIVSPGKNNFYAKFDTSGAKLWVKNISGSSTGSRFANVKVYQNEYYFNGYFRDDMNFDLKTITSNVAGKQDLFLYKTDINGDGIWIRRTYGDDIDVTGSITGDNYGNVYFTGYFQSSTLSADSTETVLANQVLNHVNDFDIFILKYNKSGTLQLNKHFGKNGRDYGIDLNVNNDILYMSGYYSDTIVFGNDTLSSTGTSDRDMFLTSFDLNANPYNSISLGGTDGDDIAAGAIVLNSGEAVMGGYFQSTTLTVGDSTYTNGGVFDGIIAKYYAPLSTAFTKITNPTCNSQSNGELIITPIFGEMPYTYTWSHDGGLTDSTATGLSAGFYSVTVTDALDSTDVAQYTLTEPGAFLFNPVITQITSCSYSQEGAINLNVTGGNGGNTYQWAQSDGGNGVVLTAKDQSGLAIGTYSVTVTDTESCTGDTVIYITGPDPITFGGSVVTDSSGIESGAIDLVCSGGSGDPASFTFNWQGPTGPPTHSEDTSNLSPGNYSVTVTDVNVCEFDTMFNVANLDTFYIYISDYKDACNNTFNGNATVSYSSPHGHTAITYLWDANTGSQTTAQATGLASGRYYYVTVTDTENTPNTVLVDSVYIDELSYIFAGSLAGTTTLDCYGDTDGYIDLSITTEGELPYTYNWSNSETTQDITNLAIGTYSVTATDANECTFSITDYVIDQPTALAAVAEIVNNPTCNGDLDGEVTVLRNGGTVPYTYQWNDQGSQTTQNADGLDAGYYTVTVTDFNSCTAVSSINLTEPEQIIIDTTVNHLSCNSDADGSIQLSVSGGTVPFTYFWSTTNGSGLVV